MELSEVEFSEQSEVIYMKDNNPDTEPNDLEKMGFKADEYIINRFRSTFKGIFNIVELALDEDKAETAKSLIGDSLAKTRDDCIKYVNLYYAPSK